MDIEPQSSPLRNMHSNMIGGLRMRISIEKIINEDDASMEKLFNRLKTINLQDKKKRSVRRKVSKARENRVKQKINFSENELFRIGLTNLLITVIRDEDEMEVCLKNINNDKELKFPLCR